jgi:DNA-binding response OmpR family regulator
VEPKTPTRPTPALGRVALKKKAVSIPAAPAPEPAVVLRRVLVGEADEGVRNAVAASLPRDRFQVWAYGDGDSAYDHFQAHGADIVILGREMPGLAGTVLCELFRKGKFGTAVTLLLMSPRYRDRLLGARDCAAFGADEFVPLPTTPDVLLDRVDAAISKREPIERLNVLPAELAREIDQLWEQLDKLTYYELLGVPAEADRPALQTAFHERSLKLHPDRHARLRASHPHAWEKINTVYKRVSEAYKTLTNGATRRSYNVGLRKRGAVRLEPDEVRRREMREMEAAQTPEGRQFVLQSLECRSLGDLEGAADALRQALRHEPENTALRDMLDAIEKLLFIVGSTPSR